MSNLTIKRSHSYYWIVECKVPVDIAWILYKGPLNQQIRVEGHCGCVEPVDPWITWRINDKRVASLKSREELQRLVDKGFLTVPNYMDQYWFTDNPVGAEGWIELYHIDTDPALMAFIETLRSYGVI